MVGRLYLSLISHILCIVWREAGGAYRQLWPHASHYEEEEEKKKRLGIPARVFRAGLESDQPHVLRRIGLYDGLLLGQDLLGDCVNMNGAPRIRTPSRRSGARSCHAPGVVAARGPPVGVLRSAAHRRAESRFWGVFIFAVHRAFVLGLGGPASRYCGSVRGCD